MYFDREMRFLRKAISTYLLRKMDFDKNYAVIVIFKSLISRSEYIENKNPLKILLL